METKYMFMSYHQTTKISHKVANKSFKNVADLRYLGIMVKYQNCIHEEIKSRLNLGHAYYHALQYILSPCLLSKNIKIKIWRTVTLPAVLCGCEIWPVTLREERRFRVTEQGA
jgi:hypothetical protein